MLSRVLSRLETSPFQSSFRLRALALPNCELRNVLSAISRHVVHFNIDRLARLICRVPLKSRYISDMSPYIPTFPQRNTEIQQRFIPLAMAAIESWNMISESLLFAIYSFKYIRIDDINYMTRKRGVICDIF